MWVVYHQIFEPEGPLGYDHPILVHMFYGKTREDAIQIYQAHRKTDQFLKSCDDLGKWRNVVCHVEKAVSKS